MASDWNLFKRQILRQKAAPLLASSANELPNMSLHSKTDAGIIVLIMVIATLVVLVEGHNCTAEGKPDLNFASIALVQTNGGSHVTRDILSPDMMFNDFGFVSAPVFGVTMKAFFNLFVQLAFLLGMTTFAGNRAIADRLRQKPDFGKLSIAFQIFGQLSAIFAYISLALSTDCWENFANWQKFSFGVSQHSSTITIIVGLANNITMTFMTDSPCQRKTAKILVISGFIIGLPVWSTIAMALISWAGVLLLLPFTSLLFLGREGDMWRGSYSNKLDTWGTQLWLWTAFVVVMWVILGIWRHPFYALMLLGATLVELLLPCGILSFYFEKILEVDPAGANTGASMKNTFIVALLATYMVSMAVPTCILTQQDPGYFFTGAVLTFWGKNIKKYFAVSYVYPAEQQIRNATSGAHFVSLWVSQMLGLIS